MTLINIQNTTYSTLPGEEPRELAVLDRLHELHERALKTALEFMGCDNIAKLSSLSLRHRTFAIVPSRPSFNPIKLILNRRLYFSNPQSERQKRIGASLKPEHSLTLRKKFFSERQKMKRLGEANELPYRKKGAIEYRKCCLLPEINDLERDVRIQRRRLDVLDRRFGITHKENIALSVAMSGGYFLSIDYPEEYQRIQARLESVESELSHKNKQVEILNDLLERLQKCNEWTKIANKLQK
ncbi:MAG: hypothetical protein ACI9S8_003207 [Chlamydiales bacterium]|jgi:hypothetical protein